MHNYPLSLRFKVISISSQIYVLDANGSELCYVKQKAFKLREEIRIFTNSNQKDLMGAISAHNILDFSGGYSLKDENQLTIGTMTRHGIRSFWQAHYEVTVDDSLAFNVTEANPIVKFIDGFIGSIPVVGVIANYLLHPKYEVVDTGGNRLFSLKKMPSFFERRFQIDALSNSVDEKTEKISLLAMMLVVLLEGDDG